MMCGSFKLHRAYDDIGSTYQGYLVHFPAPSPKNKNKPPCKNVLCFSENFFSLYFRMNADQS